MAGALAKAQGAYKAATATTVGVFDNKYATLADIWDACRAPLSANGLSVMQLTSADGPHVSVETVLAHSSGEWMSSTLTMTAKDAGPQPIGSCISYARRYALGAITGVVTGDDDGEAATDHAKAPPERAPRQRSIHEAPSTARDRQQIPDARKEILALMKHLAFTPKECADLSAEYKDNPDGLIAHLEALTDAPAKPEPGDADFPF